MIHARPGRCPGQCRRLAAAGNLASPDAGADRQARIWPGGLADAKGHRIFYRFAREILDNSPMTHLLLSFPCGAPVASHRD
jgi:hypothetical protein